MQKVTTSEKIIDIVRMNEFPRTIVVVGPTYSFNYNTLVPRLIKDCQAAGLHVERARFVQLTVEDYVVQLIVQQQLEGRIKGIECTVINHVEN